jgi:tetratricopeptide (TPR) repeat protein
MAVATRRHEMLPYKLDPQLTSLFTEIAAGNPVLVLQNLSFEWYPQWHYAVAVGYDLDQHEIILRSGTSRRWVTPIDVFERTWQRADYWALVILPVNEVPRTAQPLSYLQTVYAFEETGNTGIAQKAYQSAAKQWPDSNITWTALGNMALLNKDWQQSVTAFQTAVALDRKSITSWNNLAYALHSYGCGEQSKQALQCALKIAPDDENLHDSSRELADRPVAAKRGICPQIHCD